MQLTMERLTRQLLHALMLTQGIAAFMQCGSVSVASGPVIGQVLSPGLKLRTAVGTKGRSCRMTMVDEEEAMKSMQSWILPKDCRLMCSPSVSDAGVMASFLKEVSSAASGSVMLISPNCESSAEASSMNRMAEYLNTLCPWTDVKAVTDAPQPGLSFTTSNRPSTSSASSASDLAQEEVMSKVLDWFTTMLIDMNDEEEYVNVGRILLSVKGYTVAKGNTEEEVAEAFWRESAGMVEGKQDGNVMLVAPDFFKDDAASFSKFIDKTFAKPLESWGAGSEKQLRVSAYHPQGTQYQSPWPLISIYVYDPPPPRAPTDLTAEDEVTINDDMETLSIPTDKLRTKLKRPSSEPDFSMPGFPLKIDELKD